MIKDESFKELQKLTAQRAKLIKDELFKSLRANIAQRALLLKQAKVIRNTIIANHAKYQKGQHVKFIVTKYHPNNSNNFQIVDIDCNATGIVYRIEEIQVNYPWRFTTREDNLEPI